MEPARVEVTREAASILWVAGFLESHHEVGLPSRDGSAPRVDSCLVRGRWPPRRRYERADAGGLWLAIPRAFQERLDARGDFLEAAPLEPKLAVDSHD